ncbi:hypothetical protein B0H16DRAFT_1450614 [Mycena metata]|uniref:Uncharacterized protein n=1 Tax=Mycena metata TaxID=1033252 RepID=A0AAD7NSW5_9AGAR|nr:hypothetical protein B0H16DRAFT_1450614 [Mycena metata]
MNTWLGLSPVAVTGTAVVLRPVDSNFIALTVRDGQRDGRRGRGNGPTRLNIVWVFCLNEISLLACLSFLKRNEGPNSVGKTRNELKVHKSGPIDHLEQDLKPKYFDTPVYRWIAVTARLSTGRFWTRKICDGTGTAPVERVPSNRHNGNGRQPYTWSKHYSTLRLDSTESDIWCWLLPSMNEIMVQAS